MALDHEEWVQLLLPLLLLRGDSKLKGRELIGVHELYVLMFLAAASARHPDCRVIPIPIAET